MSAQLTCHQVLRGEEEAQDWEQVWREGSQGGVKAAAKDTWPGFPVGKVPGSPNEAAFRGQREGQKHLGQDRISTAGSRGLHRGV